ncbi:MAG: pyridoxamine 5'-phosphate oxidase family protein [Firmicutes bacterium]|nr:pyridoxamine 5'-phosphate oxidase family protein [Bacillota bacterium]
MKNPDNKTIVIYPFDLVDFADIISPLNIATVTPDGAPNLCLVSDVHVIDETHILISNNEMNQTPLNIRSNNRIVATCFNDNLDGIRLTGIAEYHTSGKWFDLAVKMFKNERTTPKGAIVIKVSKAEKF